jgi:hypothetical protein
VSILINNEQNYLSSECIGNDLLGLSNDTRPVISLSDREIDSVMTLDMFGDITLIRINMEKPPVFESFNVQWVTFSIYPPRLPLTLIYWDKGSSKHSGKTSLAASCLSDTGITVIWC